MKNNIKYIYLFILSLAMAATAVAQADEATPLDVKPEYPGGVQALRKYIAANFRVPEVEEDIVARIHLSFVVETDGTLSGIKVIKDPGYGMAEEAIRVLKACPQKWTPGMQNGKPVKASYVLPISINAQGYSPKEEVPTQSTPKE